jgi:hypothetical protein
MRAWPAVNLGNARLRSERAVRTMSADRALPAGRIRHPFLCPLADRGEYTRTRASANMGFAIPPPPARSGASLQEAWGVPAGPPPSLVPVYPPNLHCRAYAPRRTMRDIRRVLERMPSARAVPIGTAWPACLAVQGRRRTGTPPGAGIRRPGFSDWKAPNQQSGPLRLERR